MECLKKLTTNNIDIPSAVKGIVIPSGVKGIVILRVVEGSPPEPKRAIITLDAV